MAITSNGARGSGTGSTSGTTLTHTPGVAVSAGEVLLTFVTTRENVAVASITDAVGNVWSPVGVYENAANGDARVELWMCKVQVAMLSTTTITTTWASAVVDKCVASWSYSVGAGNVLALDTSIATNPITNEVNATTGYGSAAFSGAASASRLWLRVLAKQANSTSTITASTNFTSWALALRSRNSTSAITARAEFRINASTGETSNPTLAVTGDTASIFAALIEQAPALDEDGGGVGETGYGAALQTIGRLAAGFALSANLFSAQVADAVVNGENEPVPPQPIACDDSTTTLLQASGAPGSLVLRMAGDDSLPLAVVTLDDDTWQNPVRPTVPAYATLPAWAFEQHDLPIAPTPAAGDYGSGLFVTFGGVAPRIVRMASDAEFVAPPAFTPEEDAWQNPVPPAVSSFRAPDPNQWDQADGVVRPAAPIAVEDYWSSGVAPQPLTFRLLDPSQFEQHDIVSTPPIDAGDDASTLLTFGQPAARVLRFPGGGDELPTAPAALTVDDDAFTMVQPPFVDHRIPAPWAFSSDAAVAAAPTLTVDSDEWQNPLVARAASNVTVAPWRFATDEVASPAAAIVAEEEWAPPTVAPRAFAAPSPWAFATDDIPSPPAPAAPNEEYWTNPVAPIPQTFRAPQPFAFEQHAEAFTPPSVVDDESGWQAPRQTSNARGALPAWSFDQPDLPVAPPNEDSWSSGVAPVAYESRRVSLWITSGSEMIPPPGQPPIYPPGQFTPDANIAAAFVPDDAITPTFIPDVAIAATFTPEPST